MHHKDMSICMCLLQNAVIHITLFTHSVPSEVVLQQWDCRAKAFFRLYLYNIMCKCVYFLFLPYLWHLSLTSMPEIHLAHVMLEKLGWELIGFLFSRTSLFLSFPWHLVNFCPWKKFQSLIEPYWVTLIKIRIFCIKGKKGKSPFKRKYLKNPGASAFSPDRLFSCNLSSSPDIPL